MIQIEQRSIRRRSYIQEPTGVDPDQSNVQLDGSYGAYWGRSGSGPTHVIMTDLDKLIFILRNI